MPDDKTWVLWFEELAMKDVPFVGGKNASLGEMIRNLRGKGIRVPDGFATTAAAYWAFLDFNGLRDKIASLMEEHEKGRLPLAKAGKAARALILKAVLPPEIKQAVLRAYGELSARYGGKDTDVAVRSSATAEDLPDASFAGQQETFLNVRGGPAVLKACLRSYASLFTDRAISYRGEKGFSQMKVALSIGVQKMVRSDLAGSGVMFTLDTESGFPGVVLINAAWGLGENVVQGFVNPDEYMVFKPLLDHQALKPIIKKSTGDKEKKLVYGGGTGKSTRNTATTPKERLTAVLSDAEILDLARWGMMIEEHYG